MKNTLLLIVILILFCGCAGQVPKEADDAFYMNDYRKAAELARPYENNLNRNFALNNAKLATIYFTDGAYDLAFSPLLNAGKVMERTVTSSGNAFWSAVSREDFKEFKGEPFDRSMCHWYRGIIHYKRGDYEKALAAFRRALDADKDTMSTNSNDAFDFASAYIMASRCYYLLGEPDTAFTYLQNSNCKLQEIDADNSVFIVEWGDSPLKKRDNNVLECSAFADYIPRSCEIEHAKIFVDGKEKITLNPCTSLFKQLSSNTERAANTIQKIKLGAKWTIRICAYAAAFTGVMIASKGQNIAGATAAGVAAALVAGMVIRTEADVRVWNTLPDVIGISSLSLTPGFHHIAVCFYDFNDNEIEEWRQVYYYYPIKKDDNLIYSRAAFCHFGNFKFTTEKVNNSVIKPEIKMRHYLEIEPESKESDIRVIPLAPAFWKENEVHNFTIF